MKILNVTFTPMNGCLVRFDGWHDAADIDSKTVFLHAGCVHIAPLDARDVAAADELMSTPVPDTTGYGHRNAVLAELAARHAVWCNADPAPTADRKAEPLAHVDALLALQQFITTHRA